MKLVNASLIGALAALSAGCAHAVTNLVTNGDFETGDLTGWSSAGWSVTRGFGGATPDSGSYFASTGCVRDCTLGQDVTTTPSQSYVLTFAFNPGVDANSGGDTYVTFGGATVADMAGGALGWRNHWLEVTATGSSTALVFSGHQIPAYNGLDGVSVLPIPEPAAWTVMLLGLGITCAALRRRRAQSSFSRI